FWRFDSIEKLIVTFPSYLGERRNDCPKGVSSFRFHSADRAMRERRESGEHAKAGESGSFYDSGKTEGTWAAEAGERPPRPVGCGPYLCAESARSSPRDLSWRRTVYSKWNFGNAPAKAAWQRFWARP